MLSEKYGQAFDLEGVNEVKAHGDLTPQQPPLAGRPASWGPVGCSPLEPRPAVLPTSLPFCFSDIRQKDKKHMHLLVTIP